jgi:hypothetical protein
VKYEMLNGEKKIPRLGIFYLSISVDLLIFPNRLLMVKFYPSSLSQNFSVGTETLDVRADPKMQPLCDHVLELAPSIAGTSAGQTQTFGLMRYRKSRAVSGSAVRSRGHVYHRLV